MQPIEESVIQAVVQQMNKLMIRSRSPFLEQYENQNNTVKWRQQNHTLTDNVVRSHVLGQRTAGIFYANKSTTFLVFDVDAQDDVMGQEIRVKGIVHALKELAIDEQHIHIMFSGMKGYHIQLFFDKPVRINSVAAFGRSIIAKLNDYASGVELRPEAENGRGVKLPLAYHKKSGMNAIYVDKFTLEPVSDSYKYFLSIQPMDTEIMLTAISKSLQRERVNRAERFASKKLDEFTLEPVDSRMERAEKDFSRLKMPVNKKSGLRDKAEKLLQDGLTEKGTRHQTQFFLALYFKDSNFPVDEAVEQLKEWINIQWENKMTNETDLNFLRKEAERCVRYVYSKESYLGLFDSRGRVPKMTYDDVMFAAKYTDKNIRLVVWALLMIGRMYHEQGQFFAPMQSIVQITGLSRPTVSKIIIALTNNTALQIIEEWTYTKEKARVYYMPYLAVNCNNEDYLPIQSEDTVSSLYKKSMYLVELVIRYSDLETAG